MDKFELKPCPFCGKKLKFYKETYVNSRGEKCNQWYFMHDVDDDCVLDTIFNVFTIPAGDANRETGYPGRYGVEWNKRASGWIPCSERMPKRDTMVIINMMNGNVRVGCYEGNTGFHDKWSVQPCVTLWDNEVTHWMPLPEPPGGDE